MRTKLPAHLQAARDSARGDNNNAGRTMSQYSQSKKTEQASVTSSKARVPAWMQQVKQPDEEGELTLDDLDDPALMEELDMERCKINKRMTSVT